MTLFQMWELINYIANKDYEGNVITPEDFNSLIKVANLDLLKIKMGLPEDLRPGQPMTRQYLDVNKVMTDDTRFLKVSLSDQSLFEGTTTPEPNATAANVWAYPSDYLTIDTIRTRIFKTIDGGARLMLRMVEIITEDRLSDRLGRWVKRPTEWDSVGVIRSDGIHIYPSSLSSIDVMYVRYPKTPEFIYVSQEGYIEEAISTTTPPPGIVNEFEWGENLHNDLVRLVLGYIGINIRDQVLLGYAEQKKQEGV